MDEWRNKMKVIFRPNQVEQLDFQSCVNSQQLLLNKYLLKALLLLKTKWKEYLLQPVTGKSLYSNQFGFKLGAEGRSTGVYKKYMRIARARRQQRLKSNWKEYNFKQFKHLRCAKYYDKKNVN